MDRSIIADTLLIVDVQKGFINEKTQHIPEIVEHIQYGYKNVFVTRFVNLPGSFYRTLIGWDSFSPGSEDTDFAFELRPDAIILNKAVYTCVTPWFLSMLHDMEIEAVDICGIDTDICVTKCAVDLFEAGIVPFVLKDFCATHAEEDLQEPALKILARYIGEGQII